MLSGQRLRTLFKTYGLTAVGTYLTVSAVTFWGIYFALENNIDVHGHLTQWGLLLSPPPPQSKSKPLPSFSDNKKLNVIEELIYGKGTSVAIAMICTKALVPIKIPIAASLTPIVHRGLRSIGMIKPKTYS